MIRLGKFQPIHGVRQLKWLPKSQTAIGSFELKVLLRKRFWLSTNGPQSLSNGMHKKNFNAIISLVGWKSVWCPYLVLWRAFFVWFRLSDWILDSSWRFGSPKFRLLVQLLIFSLSLFACNSVWDSEKRIRTINSLNYKFKIRWTLLDRTNSPNYQKFGKSAAVWISVLNASNWFQWWRTAFAFWISFPIENLTVCRLMITFSGRV